jgi:K+-transporting ATPase ATPase C chain
MAHVRAMAWLLVLTVVVVCVLYPLCLWLIGQALFPTRAQGSLIVENGEVRGSQLIAQPFTQPKYFKPRPSAVGYNAAASGGSNLAASNPLLRDRVARQLGPMVRFANSGKPVGSVVQAWFAGQPGYLATWAQQNPTLAQRWVKDDDNKKAAIGWLERQPDLLDGWRKKQTPVPEKVDFDKALDDLAVPFFERFAQQAPTHWPVPDKDKLLAKKVPPVQADSDNISDLQGVMFDPWLAAHPDEAERIEKVPADLVLASGSGLDPHITLRGARYQLPDVVAARAKETGQSEREVRERISAVLDRHSFRPLGFLGEPLVNVVEVNRALDRELPAK